MPWWRCSTWCGFLWSGPSSSEVGQYRCGPAGSPSLSLVASLFSGRDLASDNEKDRFSLAVTPQCPSRWPQHRKLPLLQLRQKSQQTIHHQEPTLGRRKKLPIGKSKSTPPPVGPAFCYRPFFLSFLRPDDELAISKGAQTFLRPFPFSPSPHAEGASDYPVPRRPCSARFSVSIWNGFLRVGRLR